MAESATPRRPLRSRHGRPLVAAEVIHDHDVAGAKRRDEDMAHIGPEYLAVDGAVDDHGCIDAAEAQAGRALPAP